MTVARLAQFGLMLLELFGAAHVKDILETMIRVTMMRGAQSAGLVTYQPTAGAAHGGPWRSPKAVRKRVNNGKRTDLCTLLLKEYEQLLQPAAMSSPQLFQGHTRFATSSIAALPGCHPHQWTPPSTRPLWRYDSSASRFVGGPSNVEGHITHNGDLDFAAIHGIVYPLEELQPLLVRLLHCPMPAAVDSACVAGLLDLLRAKGMWHASVRVGYVYGALAAAGNLMQRMDGLWSKAAFEGVVSAFERVWTAMVHDMGR
jgi:hypothetical protein